MLLLFVSFARQCAEFVNNAWNATESDVSNHTGADGYHHRYVQVFLLHVLLVPLVLLDLPVLPLLFAPGGCVCLVSQACCPLARPSKKTATLRAHRSCLCHRRSAVLPAKGAGAHLPGITGHAEHRTDPRIAQSQVRRRRHWVIPRLMHAETGRIPQYDHWNTKH